MLCFSAEIASVLQLFKCGFEKFNAYEFANVLLGGVKYMSKICFGKENQVCFRDWHEYYFALGFLANSNNAEIRWEHNENQGAWGSEGRIHCLVPCERFPQNFNFTAGRGSVYARINCNDYVKALVEKHKFSMNSRNNSFNEILSTVPDEYVKDFRSGYNN